MTSTVRTVPTRWRRLVPAALIAAAVTLSGTAFGDPAVAHAEPQEFDIGAYEQCITTADNLYLNGAISAAMRDGMYRGCCVGSGGVVKNDVECKAANAPGRTVPPGVIKQNVTPAPVASPPGDITQTFTPAP